MAVSRDQAARIVRAGSGGDGARHGGSDAATENPSPLPSSCALTSAEETKRRTAEAPETPVTDKPAAPAAADARRRNPASANSS